MAVRDWMRGSPLVAFFVIAFSITWFCQILGLLLARGSGLTLANEDNLMHLFALFTLRLAPGEASAYLIFTLGAGPLVAALLVTWAADGRRGIEELWGRIKK